MDFINSFLLMYRTEMRKGLFRKGGEMMVVVVAWLVGSDHLVTD